MENQPEEPLHTSPTEQQSKNHIDNTPHKHARKVLALFALLLLFIIILFSLLLTKELDNSKMNEATDTKLEQVGTTNEEQSQAELNALSENWLTFSGSEYIIKIPDGWDMIHQDNDVLLMACDGLPYCYALEDGTIGTVTETIGGRDGLQGFLFAIQSSEFTLEDFTKGYTVNTEVIDGYEMYIRKVVAVSEDDLLGNSLPVGATEYLLLRTLDDGRIMYVNYSVLPEQSDPIRLVREMLSTLEIL